MGYVLIKAPTVEPVSVPEAMAHLRITSPSVEESVYVAGQLRAARRTLETWTGRQFMSAIWELTLAHFPCPKDGIALPRAAPLATIDGFWYRDGAGVEQLLAPARYTVDSTVEWARVYPAFGQAWPGIRQQHNAIRIRYTAGAATPDLVPEEAKAAIKLFLSQLYEHREPVITGTIATEIPLSLTAIVNDLKVDAVA